MRKRIFLKLYYLYGKIKDNMDYMKGERNYV